MRAKRVHKCLGVVVACVFLAPAGAAASTARVIAAPGCDAEQFECNGFSPGPPTVGYGAAAGEANALELSFADGVATLRDPGAAISAGEACTSVSVHEAACRPGGGSQFSVALGDLADTFTIAGPFLSALTTSIDAGAGADVVSGGPGRDSVIAGAGDDQVSGGGDADSLKDGEGRDSLQGGPGDDTLLAAERVAAVDVFDGGAGRDAVSFAGRRSGVSATPVGAEGDTFTNVEDLVGGAGDDRLTGDDGANGLTGGRGADRLVGGPGPDVLAGGDGRDELRAGTGDDQIVGNRYELGGDRFVCGPGVDTILDVNPADELARDCERVNLGLLLDDSATMRPYPAAVRGGVARFAIPCRSRHGCRGSVHVQRAAARRGGAQRRFRTRRRGRITVAVPLPRGGKKVRVDISLSLRGGDEDSGRVGYTIKIPR